MSSARSSGRVESNPALGQKLIDSLQANLASIGVDDDDEKGFDDKSRGGGRLEDDDSDSDDALLRLIAGRLPELNTPLAFPIGDAHNVAELFRIASSSPPRSDAASGSDSASDSGALDGTGGSDATASSGTATDDADDADDDGENFRSALTRLVAERPQRAHAPLAAYELTRQQSWRLPRRRAAVPTFKRQRHGVAAR